MQKPPLTPDEPFRLAEVARTNILDTPIEPRFERITRLTKRMLGVPIVTVSIVDADRQWFKSTQGLSCAQTSRDISFCGHAINEKEYMIVPDARQDPRFHDNPLVTGEPHIVFYAGVILRSTEGAALGMLCAIDHEPRQLTPEDLETLRDFAKMAERELNQNTTETIQSKLIAEIKPHRRNAMIDPLSRVWNQQGINYMLGGQLNHYFKTEEPFALMIMAVDRIDRIIDEHGQNTGELVLREIARRTINSIRTNDQVGRYDTDKFLLVLNSVSRKQEILDLAQQITVRLSAAPILIDNDLTLGIKISAGITLCNSINVASTDHLITTAKQAMDTSRSDGPNHVAFKPTVPTPPDREKQHA